MTFFEFSYIELDGPLAIQLSLFSPNGGDPVFGKMQFVATPAIYQMYRTLLNYYSGDGYLEAKATKQKIERLFFGRYAINPTQLDFEIFLAEEYASILQKDKVTAYARKLDSDLPGKGVREPRPWKQLTS